MDGSSVTVLDEYSGVDFANREKRTGRCFLRDDGHSLTLTLSRAETGKGVRSYGVDCPFGTSAEFFALLNGSEPQLHSDGSCESRMTERWLRRMVKSEYLTPSLWRDARELRLKKSPYFHPTTHIQPSVGLRIVPSCLLWLIRHPELPGGTIAKLRAARRGDSCIVEAHPRMFLYSMIERVYRANADAVTLDVLTSVCSYKDAGKNKHRQQREALYQFLRRHPEWTGATPRQIEPQSPEDAFFESDHTFDAWLSALTAWAATWKETISWSDANDPHLTEEKVDIEGHIQVLNHVVKT